ncbi:ATP-binding cassette domain-containing protein [Pseudactinotalea sp.]|uniref:ATP-binding cassette domain-containing protein n=1 Tax=Pseudactinotalea sp. TaxID=1926260 RepID=UPI003B3BEA17
MAERCAARHGEALVRLDGVTKDFPIRGAFGVRTGVLRAVDGVSLDIREGENLGLVGESGSGKTTLGRMILQMESPTVGSISFGGVEQGGLGRRELQRYRRQMQIVFQDPYSALSPQRTALQQVTEPLEVLTDDPDPEGTAEAVLARVGIDDVHKFPREFSGGQRQRIVIARAIAVNPQFVVCDEALSALDVSVQAQILGLLRGLQRDLGLTYLFISHDLAVVRELCDRIAVLYRGQLVEIGPTGAVFADPRHPYTRKLLAAIPVADPRLARDPARRQARAEAAAARIDVPEEPLPLIEVGPAHLAAVG